MSTDDLLRAGAVVAAVAILAAPYRQQAAAWVAQAWASAAPYRGLAARVAAAGLLLYAAWGHLPSLPAVIRPPAQFTVEEPSEDMRAVVAPVAEAMKSMPAGDRLLWAHVWTKAGVVVAGDAISTETAFTDTRSLRAFTALAIDIAWRRIGKHATGSNEPLREAVEAAYKQVLGKDVVPVTADLRARYVEFAKAIAWAGQRKG